MTLAPDSGLVEMSVESTGDTYPMMTSTHQHQNGIDSTAVHDARTALEGASEAAAFVWRAQCQWVTGMHARTSVERFSGLGAELGHRSPHVLETDAPRFLGAGDNAMTPTEVVLGGLAGCLVAAAAAAATERGVEVRSITAHVVGRQDLRASLGIDSPAPAGCSEISVRMVVDADASVDALDEIVAEAHRRSAVSDLLSRPVVVTVDVI